MGRGEEGQSVIGKDFHYLHATIENEGFDYAFCGYSDFEEVQDAKFHELRIAYLKAKDALAEYVGAESDRVGLIK